MNTVEADYEFNPRFGIFGGYRYTKRHIETNSQDQNLASPPVAVEQQIFDNHANAAIFGFRARPKKIWTIYFDGEKGTTDNVFVRVENYKYTNFRVEPAWLQVQGFPSTPPSLPNTTTIHPSPPTLR